MAERRFSESDIRRWAARGLITQAQADSILAAEREATAPPAPEEAETEEGLNLPTVLYYLGGSLVVTALWVFAALNWEDVSRAARIPAVGLGMLALLLSGHYVRIRTPYHRGGGALFALGVGMVSLFYLSIADAALPGDETIFSGDKLSEATLVQLGSLATMLAALAWSRVPLVSLAVAGQSIALTTVAGMLWLGNEDTDGIMLIVLGTGATLLLISLVAYYVVALAEHGLWFSLAGHGAFFFGFTFLAMDNWAGGVAALYLLTFSAFVLVSLAIRQPSYLVAGLCGVYAFIGRLIQETFEDSPLMPLALALVGVSLVALAILYQRYRPGDRGFR